MQTVETIHSPAPIEIPYRPHIDGLRAIAVLLVLLQHLGIRFTRGGFIGVDVFFVISGYLITGNIARLIAAGKFSLPGFYARRLRRIFPALLAMLAGISVFAYFVFPPIELVEYSWSLLSAAFSYSNLYLSWTSSGYFSLSYTRILPHTWSLGVEEQFYLLIPLTMLLCANRPRLLRCLIVVAGFISLVWATYFAFQHNLSEFYAPQSRAWELLAGALISLGMVRCPNSRTVREAMVATGLAVIALYMVFFSARFPFPGISAVPPCLAAMLIIMAGGETSVGAVLRWKPLVFIGLLSYSLYLWHFPLIVMVRLGVIHGLRPQTFASGFVIIAVSLLLAYLSWRFVEQPFRTGRFRTLSQRRIFLYAGTGGLAFATVAMALRAEHGRQQRFSPEARSVGAYVQIHPQVRAGSCFIEGGSDDFVHPDCLQRVQGKKNVLLFGDSHAAALWWGLKQDFPDIHFLQATQAVCSPIEESYGRSSCSMLRRFIYQRYLPENHVDAVILSERWMSIQDLHAMEPALKFFQSRAIPVIVVGPAPEYSAPLPFLLAFGLKRHDLGLAGRNRVDGQQLLDQQLRAQLSGRTGITYASIWDAICTAGSCREYADGTNRAPMLVDTDHLSDQGSVDVVEKMKNAGELPLL